MTMGYATPEVYITQARSAHRCDWCGESILMGGDYWRWCWYEGGEASTVKAHPECVAASREVDDPHEALFGRNEPRGCQCGHEKGCPRCGRWRKTSWGSEATVWVVA